MDKKPSAMNWINNRGYSVSCDVTLKSDVIKSVLKTSAGALAELNSSKNYVGSSLAGCIGKGNVLTQINLRFDRFNKFAYNFV